MQSSAQLSDRDEGRALSCLCVDLDGTLVQTDTLIESVLAYVRVQPWLLFRLFAWLFLGKARFKQELGRAVRLQPDALPYSNAILDYIRSESKRGRRLLLVTAADSSIAIPVANHLNVFEQVICSDGHENVAGVAKLAAIRRVLGDHEFSYVGNSRSDLPVWKGAQSAVIVGASAGIRRKVEQYGVTVEKVFPGYGFSLRALLKAMRIYQWTKNLLVLMPIALGHHVREWGTVVRGIRAFLAFSLCASAIYLVNDLLDLSTDRKHARKCHRPLAAGTLSIPVAAFAAVVLLIAAMVINPTADAAILLTLYGVSAIAYSLYLKRLLMIDVIMLAGF